MLTAIKPVLAYILCSVYFSVVSHSIHYIRVFCFCVCHICTAESRILNSLSKKAPCSVNFAKERLIHKLIFNKQRHESF